MRTTRAVVVGFVVGALSAVAPSCSAPAVPCSLSTCANGCCDEHQVCQPGTTATQCGTLARTCQSCGAGQCSFGACMLTTTGGGGGGGGSLATGGGCGTNFCVSPTSGSHLCAPDNDTDLFCGTGGATCRTCQQALGEHCLNSVCTLVGSGGGAFGGGGAVGGGAPVGGGPACGPGFPQCTTASGAVLCPPFNQTPQNCGSAGLCQTCMPGSQCVNFTCVPTLPDAGVCRNLGPQPASSVQAVFFDPIDGGPLTVEGAAWVISRNPDMTVDVLQAQVDPQRLPAGGVSVTFSGADGLATCSACIVFATNCNATGCGRLYFTQGGSMAVLAVGTDFRSGFMAGVGGMLHLVEWDEMGDRAVPAGGCVEVPTFDYRESYQYLGGQQWAFDAG